MKVSEINGFNKITIEGCLCRVDIDKKNHSIFYTAKFSERNPKDITQLCEQMEKEITVGDIVFKTPYKFGQVVSKILNNRTDRRCINFLNGFTIITE